MSDEDNKPVEDDDAPADNEAESAESDVDADDGGDAAAADAKTKTKTKTKSGDDEGERMDLPKWNRAKVKRKQVKGEEKDAFQRSVRKAGRLTLTRAPVVLGGIMAVAAIISGVVWYRNSQAENAAVATRILAQAVGFQARAQVVDVEQYTKDRKHPFPIPLVNTEEERDTKVEKSLADLDDAAEGTPADVLASLVEAARMVKKGEFANAESSYQAFLEQHSDHEFSFLARENLAFAMEAQGNVDGALAEFETLAGKEGDFYRDQALWHKGRILEGQGKPDDALAVYKQYAEEFPLEESSLAREQVIGRLQELAPDLVPKPPEGAGGLGSLGQMGLPPGLGQ